jgi:tetratricopeptide (TPR) repeat protein
MAPGGKPRTGVSQDTDDDANRCFIARRPRTWRPRKLDGTDDYGLDFQIQTVVNEEVQYIFHAQLKGTRSPRLSADGSVYSVRLSASTLRYYQDIVWPIALVLCDLTAAEDPADCPLYYVWIRDELRRVGINEIAEDQGDVTLHVPRINRLTYTTDISDYLRRASALGNVGYALEQRVSSVETEFDAGGRLDVVQGMVAGIEARSPAFLQALAEPAVEHWVKPARGTLAWHLQSAATSLSYGQVGRAAGSLDKGAPLLEGAVPLECSEFLYLQGKVLSAQDDGEGARSRFREALATQDHPRYRAAWAESELRIRYQIDRENDFADVLAQLDGTDPYVLSIKARLMAAERRYPEALAVAASFSGLQSLVTRAIVHSMMAQPTEALQACTEALACPEATGNSRLVPLILRARARFGLAAGVAIEEVACTLIPPSGVPGIDMVVLRLAWADIENAVTALGDHGWSANAEFIADIWAAAASMLGKQEETVHAMAAVARAHPRLTSLQTAVEGLAATAGNFELALEFNGGLPDEDLKHLRRVAFLHELGRHREAADSFGATLTGMDQADPLFASILTVAALSARILERNADVQAWRALLERTPDFHPQLVLLDHMLATEGVARGSTAWLGALSALERGYEELGKPLDLAMAIFLGLDPSDRDQAERCVRVAERIRQERLLSLPSTFHLAGAFITLARWDALLALIQGAVGQYGRQPRLVSLEGLALDRLGRTPEAREALEALVHAGTANGNGLRAYVDIMARCGLLEEAIVGAEQLLGRAQTSPQRMEALALMFRLVQALDPTDDRLLGLATRFGELTDQGDELEEGQYVFFFESALRFSRQASAPADYARRSEAYFASFPNSKVVMRAEVPPDASDMDRLRIAAEMQGMSAEQQAQRGQWERDLRAGAKHQYALRPLRLLAHVPDVAALWSLTKTSPKNDGRYTLPMMSTPWTAQSPEALRQKCPLLDLITLFVVADLGLLEQLFGFFPKVAIAQETWDELGMLCHPVIGSPRRQHCLALRAALAARFDQIEQPPMRGPTGAERTTQTVINTLRRVLADRDYQLYSDDLMLRLGCSDTGLPCGMCTGDLILALEVEQRITSRESAVHFAELSSWNVLIPIQGRLQVALAPADITAGWTLRQTVEALRHTQHFMLMASAVWWNVESREVAVTNLATFLNEVHRLLGPDSPVAAASTVLWREMTGPRPASPVYLGLVPEAMMMQASLSGQSFPPEIARQLWSVLFAVGRTFGGSSSTEAAQGAAIDVMAALSAQLDAELPSTVQRNMRLRFASGLPRGSDQVRRFLRVYDMTRYGAVNPGPNLSRSGRRRGPSRRRGGR